MPRIWIGEIVNRVGEEVELRGWVHTRRDMGKIIFIDLRDRSGLAQVVFTPEKKELLAAASELRSEWVVAIRGRVKARQEKQVNPNIPTGAVEIEALAVEVLSAAKTPPFPIDQDTRGVNEETRLRYRYLDLRNERLQKNLALRDAVFTFCREFLHGRNFLDVDTPILTKGTPEGAREFLVPSRLHPGKAYVLPQAPQQFKQLLMVAGLERYMQIARCFRDEDQRGDRQPEFTQLDLEMSFVEREEVMDLVEELLVGMVKRVAPGKKIQQIPFPRLSYKEAMEKYGTDRPDLRQDKNNPDLFAFCWVIDFPFFEKTDRGGWTFTHNPFSAPRPEHRDWLLQKKNISQILTSQYDAVLNGFEIGGGSIRNHQREALHRVFEILGFDQERIQKNFGHMLEAFDYGAPPHGGIALGLDRIIAIFAGEPNIREVIPFPKTGDARDPMMGAPSVPESEALADAHIQFVDELTS